MSDERGVPVADAGPIRVLFVCSGNSARSVLAEASLRREGGAAFEVHSAGTEPKGINPMTASVLAEAGIEAAGVRSKSVAEYVGQRFDYVITVCDQARQSCPAFPGGHRSFHWGYEDPAMTEGSAAERLEAFRRVFVGLGQRIHLFIPLALRERAGRTLAGHEGAAAT